MRSGLACWASCCAAIRRGRGAEPLRAIWLTPMRALASDTTRALTEPLRDAGARMDHRPAHRRHAQRRAGAAGPALSHGAGHHAGVAEPDAHPRARARGTARRRVRGGRRMARADRQQARRAGAAGAGPAVALQSRAGGVGLERHAGQPGRGDGGPVRPGVARARSRCSCAATSTRPRDRHADPARPGQVSWAGHLGARMQQPVVDEIAKIGHDAGVHQRALAGRDLVPAAARGQARVGRRDRPAPRLAWTGPRANGWSRA